MPFRLVSMALGDERFDHRHHTRDFLGRMRRDGRRADTERAHVVQIVPLIALGDDRDVDALVRRRGHDLVVDVGDVARVDHLAVRVGMLEDAAEQVEDHRRPGVTDVGAAVYGRAASIHRDAAVLARNEVALCAGQRVVEADHCALPVRRCSIQSATALLLALSKG